MEFSNKEKIGLSATAAYEVADIAWNYSYQTVISDPYNAAKLSVGEIATESSLFPWPINKTGSGPFEINLPRDLKPEESFVHNVLGHPAVRVGLFLAPIVFWGYQLYKKNKDAEWVGKRNEYADDFSKKFGIKFPGNNLEEKKSSAFLYACSVLDKNRKKINSEENAKSLLNHYYQNLGSAEIYEPDQGRFSHITKTLSKIRSTIGEKLPTNYRSR